MRVVSDTSPLSKSEISRLRQEARFFVSREIEMIILADAGEIP